MQPARPRSGLPSRAERQQQQQQHDPTVVTGGNSSIVKALQRARQCGHLKLQGRGLTSLPDFVWDIATVELPENTNWWETRETLETVDASQNEIASLPDHFANKLDQLREFNLAHNSLTALPPAQSWCELAALVNLSLGNNQLRALPEHFGHANLPPLVRLSAEHNLIQSVPSSLGMCSELVELDLSHNQLISLPPGLDGLASLKKLQLRKNRLGGLPADFLERPPPLHELDLTDNRLQTLTLAIPSLHTVLLGNNTLQALELTGCDSLQELSAPYNAFSMLPSGLPALPHLATIDLSNNRIARIDALVHCAALTRLDVSCNEISLVPPHMGNLPLNRLALTGNPLRTLPNHIREAPTPKLLAHLRGKIVDAAPQWEGDTRGIHRAAEETQARPSTRDGRRPDQGRSLITGVENEPPPFMAPPSYFDRGPPAAPELAHANRGPPQPRGMDDPYATTAQLMSRQQQAQRQQQQQHMMAQQQQAQALMQMERQQQCGVQQPMSGRGGGGIAGAGAGFNALYNRPPSGRSDRGGRDGQLSGQGGGSGRAGSCAAGGAPRRDGGRLASGGGGDSAHDYGAEARAAAEYNLRALQAAKARRENGDETDERSASMARAAHGSSRRAAVVDRSEGDGGVEAGGGRGPASSAMSRPRPVGQREAAEAHAGAANELARFVMKDGTELCVAAMGLSELPSGGYPETLTRIDASSNKLSTVPAGLAEIVPCLRALNVTSNGLSGLPADLRECEELESIKASHNSIRSLSFLDAPLLRLSELHADKNGLSDVPPSLWLCPRLKHVSLCANRLHGLASLAMPGTAGTLDSYGGGPGGSRPAPLEHLDVGENRLGELPPLALYPRLREVHVQQNGIRELPVPQIAPLMQLQTLDISMNDVSQLPPDLARLPLLQNLTIVGNPIRSIPQSVQQRGATAVIDLLRKRLPHP